MVYWWDRVAVRCSFLVRGCLDPLVCSAYTGSLMGIAVPSLHPGGTYGQRVID